MSGVPAADNLRHFHAPAYTPRLWSELLGAGLAAADMLDAIDALHQRSPHGVHIGWCDTRNLVWPCPTRLILHPEEGDQ